MIPLGAQVARTPDHASTALDEDLVILNLARDSYVAFGPVGRRIWELLEVPHQVGEVCDVLRDEFDAPLELIRSDVSRFLEELRDEGLLEVVGG